MKKFIVVTLIMATVYGMAFAQTQSVEHTQKLIRESLVFYYIDNPSVARPANISTFEIDKNAIAQNQDIASPLWTNATNLGLKNIVISLLRDSAHGGDLRLQRCVRNVLLISGKKVYVYLYNDVNNAAPDASWRTGNSVYTLSSTNYDAAHSNACWPAGADFSNRSLSASGHFGIGAYFFGKDYQYGSDPAVEERIKKSVIVHELTHTQIPLRLETGITGATMYGVNGHSAYEMLPSRNSAFDEGLANAFAFCYFYPDDVNLSKLLVNNQNLYVDNLAGCTSHTQSHCLQNRLAQPPVTTPSASCPANTVCYPIQSVPSEVLMHCETVTANIAYEFTRQFESELGLVRCVRLAVPQIRSGSTYTFAPVFKQMVRWGMNYSNRSNPSGVSTHGQHLPLAILDYYLGYQLTSKAQLESVLGTRWTAADADIDGYFPRHRPVLLGYRTSATTWSTSYLDRMALEQLNVRTPPAAGRAAGRN